MKSFKEVLKKELDAELNRVIALYQNVKREQVNQTIKEMKK